MKYAIALALLALELAGCSNRQVAWPWNKPQGVPLTKPTSQDANAVFAGAPAKPAPMPAPAPVAPAKSPLMNPGPSRDESAASARTPKAPTEAAHAPAPAASAPAPVNPAKSPLMNPDAGRDESAASVQTPKAPAASAPAPDAVPAPVARSLDKPMELTELLNPPKVEPKLVEVAPIMAPRPVGRPAAPARPTPPPAVAAAPARPTAPAAVGAAPASPIAPPAVAAAPAATAAVAAAKNPLSGPMSPRQPAKAIGPDEVIAASVVQVNRRFITIDDILRPLAAKLSKLPKGIGEQTFRDQAARLIAQEITGQITRVLVVEEAEKRLVDDQKKAIDQEIKQAQSDMLAAAGGSVTQLRQQLQREGLTLEQAMDDYRRDATFKLYLRHRFMPAIPVTRKMLWDYYCQNSQQFSTGHKVQMQIIAEPFIEFLADPAAQPSAAELAGAKTQARREIESAKARLDAGDDFAEAAKKYSRDIKAQTGGLWPMMEAGSFRETEVEKAALQLPSGGVSAPVETPHGWYIVKAVQVIPGRVVPFEEAQDQIAEILRTRMYNELTDKYFQDLLEKSHIVRSPQFNELALDRAVDRFWNK
jgi:parvulin-like peptidyl-prolyl isomerase